MTDQAGAKRAFSRLGFVPEATLKDHVMDLKGQDPRPAHHDPERKRAMGGYGAVRHGSKPPHGTLTPLFCSGMVRRADGPEEATWSNTWSSKQSLIHGSSDPRKPMPAGLVGLYITKEVGPDCQKLSGPTSSCYRNWTAPY